MFEPQEIKKNPSSKQNLSESDFPVHYLEEDQEKIKKDKNYSPANFQGDMENKKDDSLEKKLSEKQKTSPFLNNSSEVAQPTPEQNEENPRVEKKVNPMSEQPVQIKENLTIKEQPATKEVSKKPLFLILILALIILIGLGTLYYFLNYYNKGQDQSAQQSENNNEAVVSEEVAEDNNLPATENKNEFSSDKPNFLVFDGEFQAKEIIKQYAEKINKEEDGSLFEFVPVDEDYEAISNNEILTSLGVSFGDDILSKIDPENNISIFFFKEKENTIRLGLSLPSKDQTILASLKQADDNLKEQISFLFQDEDTSSMMISPFQESTFENTPIYYTNLKDDGSLSMDYFFQDNSLIITTSKLSTFAIITLMNGETE